MDWDVANELAVMDEARGILVVFRSVQTKR